MVKILQMGKRATATCPLREIFHLFRFRYRIQHGIDNLLPGHVTVVFNERIATQIEELAG